MVDDSTWKGLGRGALSLLTLGASEIPMRHMENYQIRERQNQNRQAIQNALIPPAFIQADLQNADPNIRANTQRMQQNALLGALGKVAPKEAAAFAVERAFPKPYAPVSSLGKVLQDKQRMGAGQADVFDARLSKLTEPSKPLVSLNQPAGEKKESQLAAEALRDDPRYGTTTLNERAAAARSSLSSLKTIEKLSDTLTSKDVGSFAEIQNEAKKAFSKLGLPVDGVKLGNIENIISQTSSMIGSRIGALGSGNALSDRDAKITQQTLPAIDDTLEGLKMKIALNKELESKAIERSNFRNSLRKERPNFRGPNSTYDFESYVVEQLEEYDNQKSNEFEQFVGNLVKPVERPVAVDVKATQQPVVGQPIIRRYNPVTGRTE